MRRQREKALEITKEVTEWLESTAKHKHNTENGRKQSTALILVSNEERLKPQPQRNQANLVTTDWKTYLQDKLTLPSGFKSSVGIWFESDSSCVAS
jgi:hypothetical protein